MKELFEQNEITLDRHSSKGNQLKWNDGECWYKADYAGYEGLAEYVVSQLLAKTTLSKDEFVLYDIMQFKYKENVLLGVKSKNFLKKDTEIVTLEKLYKNFCGKSLYLTIWKIPDIEERIKFFVSEITRITGIENFGEYISKLITIDAMFLNEDRHMHNVALLKDASGKYSLCPIFDNGAALLSDTKLDYPLTGDIYKLIDTVKAKTFSDSFDEQLDAVEKLYGLNIKFEFSKKEVEKIIDKAELYSIDQRERVKTIVFQQMRKYQYLMS